MCAIAADLAGRESPCRTEIRRSLLSWGFSVAAGKTRWLFSAKILRAVL